MFVGRKPLYDENALLDAAAELMREGGPAAITMSAVARTTGAPSGSVYHRFPERPELLSALWLRSLGRFHGAIEEALEGDGGREALVRAARAVVGWCAAHRADAEVLSHGRQSFGYDDWSQAARRRLDEANAAVFDRLREAGELSGASTERDFEGITMGVVELPLAAVRRHLRGPAPLPAYVEELVAVAAAALLDEVGAGTT